MHKNMNNNNIIVRNNKKKYEMFDENINENNNSMKVYVSINFI